MGLGSVLELWLLGPDVVVEPGEKLAETRAANKRDFVHFVCTEALGTVSFVKVRTE